MTIELITGAPGAGKTCYAVAERLTKESGSVCEVEDAHGVKTTLTRRLVAAGFKDLLVDHEKLPHVLTGDGDKAADIARWNAVDENGDIVMKRLPGDPPITSETVVVRGQAQIVELQRSLFNWWLWCEPGDLIACDEIQYVMPRGSFGKSPPHYIKAMEVHRHYGVDFLFITQHPQLLDTTIRALVNPHRHVRAVMGSSLCMVYVWDHASNTERISQSNKSYFKRKREHFKLYKSTVAVMKPQAAGRGVFVIIAGLLGVFGFFGYRLVHSVTSKGSAPASAASVPAASADKQLVTARTATPPSQSVLPKPMRPQRAPEWAHVPKLTGCYSRGNVCSCLDEDGRPVNIELSMCRASAAGFDGLVQWERRAPLPSAGPAYGASAPVPGGSGGLPALNPLKSLSS